MPPSVQVLGARPPIVRQTRRTHDMVHAPQCGASSKRRWWLQDTALLLPVLVSLRTFSGDLKAGGVKANYQSHRILTCLTKSARPCQSRVCSFQHPLQTAKAVPQNMGLTRLVWQKTLRHTKRLHCITRRALSPGEQSADCRYPLPSVLLLSPALVSADLQTWAAALLG